MRITVLALAAALAATAAPALARDIPSGGVTVEDVVSWLQAKGLEAKADKTKAGADYVDTAIDGDKFQVYLYDCNDGPRCGSIQFSAGFNTKVQWPAEKINKWNSDHRWGRAYADDVNDPWVEFDCDLTPGGTYELLDDEFATFRRTFRDFRSFINW